MAQPSSARRPNQPSSSRKSSSRPPTSLQRHSAGAGATRSGSSPRPSGNDVYYQRSRPSSRQSNPSSSHHSRRRSHSTSQYSTTIHVRQSHSGDGRHTHTKPVASIDTSSDVGSETSSGHYRRTHSSQYQDQDMMYSESKVGLPRKGGPLRSQYSAEEESPVCKRTSVHSDISQNSKTAKKVIEGTCTYYDLYV